MNVSNRASHAARGAVVALLVAAFAAPAAAQSDHLRCFKVKDGQKFKSALVDIAPLEDPPFPLEQGCEIKGQAKELCIPASKTVTETDATQLGVSGIEQTQPFLCYKVKCPAADLADYAVSDQFGARVLAPLKGQKICVPAVSGIVSTTTTTLPDPGVCNGATILGELTCSSDVAAQLDPVQSSDLGGTCVGGDCYSCGDPVAGAEQADAEDVYSFSCQQTGAVSLTLGALQCDLDLYVLDAGCDTSSGCTEGSTDVGTANENITFACTSGLTYYVVVESTAGCSPGAAGYTLSFTASAGTGCSEDCDDGLDNDADTDVDCDDADCAPDPVCIP